MTGYVLAFLIVFAPTGDVSVDGAEAAIAACSVVPGGVVVNAPPVLVTLRDGSRAMTPYV